LVAKPSRRKGSGGSREARQWVCSWLAFVKFGVWLEGGGGVLRFGGSFFGWHACEAADPERAIAAVANRTQEGNGGSINKKGCVGVRGRKDTKGKAYK